MALFCPPEVGPARISALGSLDASEKPSPRSRIYELEIPPLLNQIVLDCIAKNPEARQSSAEELARRLGEIEADNPWTPENAREWWERSRSKAPKDLTQHLR